jgi:hypothetical protein
VDHAGMIGTMGAKGQPLRWAIRNKCFCCDVYGR